MLFPEFQNAMWCEINLDEEAKLWFAKQPKSEVESGSNPLLDPVACEEFVSECHKKYGVDFSCGGWLEDRSTLWRGSYLDDEKCYIHLGVDFNVPAGTIVMTDHVYTILRIEDDYPHEYGWGRRIIAQEPGTSVMIIFAHLEPESTLEIGNIIPPQTTIGKVSFPPYNGGWYPHLHVQVIDAAYYQELLKDDLVDLDGYGRKEDLFILEQQFHDPMKYVTL